MDRFERLRFKVHKTKEPLNKVFPDLFRQPELKKITLRKDWDRIVRYIVFMYDPGSDLIQEFPSELKDRKEASAIEAGFTRQANGKWPAELIKIMEIRDEQVHAAIIAFLKIFRNDDWVDIVVTEQELEEFQALRFKAINDETSDLYGDAKKKDGIMDSVEKRKAALKIFRSQFFGDNKDLEKPEFEEMMTPENAERMLANMPPPYEEIKIEANPVMNVLPN